MECVSLVLGGNSSTQVQETQGSRRLTQRSPEIRTYPVRLSCMSSSSEWTLYLLDNFPVKRKWCPNSTAKFDYKTALCHTAHFLCSDWFV